MSQDASTTAFGYDGLGRGLTSTTSTEYGTETSTAVWAGTTVVQQTSDISGTATVLRDALGQIALQSATAGDTSSAATWSLQDRLGSTVAQTTTTGRVTDLVSYSDFGIPTFASTGFASSTGFTGELSDATTGLNTYFARTYDPMAATWLTADTYRGTLTNPASQHRYGYVEGNPTTATDHLGFSVLDDYAYSKRKAGPSAAKNTPSPCIGRGCNRAADSSAPAGQSDTSDRHPPICGGHGSLPGCVAREQTQQQKDNTQAVGAILAGVGLAVLATAAFAACIAATFGICGAVGAGVLTYMVGGAIIGGASSALTYGLSPGKKTTEGWLTNIGIGAGLGALTGGIAPAAGSVLAAGRIAVPTATSTVIRQASTSAGADFILRAGGFAKTAEAAADAALASGRTTGAAAELTLGREVFTDVSTGGAPRVLNEAVQQSLEHVPLGERAPWHGACAEMGCLSQALDSGVDPSGGFIRAVAIGTSNPGHGLPKAICTSCSAVLDTFGVKR